MFSSTFLFVLTIVALTWTGLGVITLLVLLFRDWKNKELW